MIRKEKTILLSKKSIANIEPVHPFVPNKRIINGMSYGLSEASYDVRIYQTVNLPKQGFILASTLEEFNLPLNVAGQVIDKSSWARKGLSCFNTFIDPGFQGFMTLELSNLGNQDLHIPENSPICQIIFFWVDETTDGYQGKYQNQGQDPVECLYQKDSTQFSIDFNRMA